MQKFVVRLLCGSTTALFLVIFLIGTASRPTFAANGDVLWSDVDARSLSTNADRRIIPERYRTVRLDKLALSNLLALARPEFEHDFEGGSNVIELPMPDGGFAKFRFFDSPIMETELAAKYPEIRTFSGQGIDDPSSLVRFDVTQRGFHAIVLRPEGSVYIDPYAFGDTDNYISYDKQDFATDKQFVCLTQNLSDLSKELRPRKWRSPFGSEDDLVNNGGTLHTYRLAMAATGEYTAFHGGTVPLAMAAITTTVNRVNAVYERDLSVRLTLIANNNLIVYTNAGTDPYANTSGDLTANQNNINTVIGTANYDVGHLVGTGGGGVAQLNSPCTTSKARGLTGSPAPIGDPFDIDYVAHELGHQFGGNHTFNSTNSSCGGGNRNASTAYEPGSASTIQGYAGICGTSDLQRNSDDYFHIISLEEMTTFITGATGESCDVDTSNGNSVPVVTAAPACTVPISTPFSLTGSATDANGDALTYTWEEYDLGASTNALPNTDASGGARPIFRSYRATTTGATRTFPSLPFILSNANVPPSTFSGTNAVGTVCSSGNCLTGELLPAITRTMQFQLTARDNRTGGGAVRSAQTAVTVSAAAGPFAVTSPNTAISWASGANQTVTWNVASTTAAPVSCPNVDIQLSTNGGTSFTTILAATPNDGTQSVLIPSNSTTTARIKVQCSTSCWFDVSNANFTLLPPTAAGVSVDGRVTNELGFGVGRMIISLTDQNGLVRTASTNSFGYFRFDELPSGATYVVTGSSKQYSIESQVITVTDQITDLTLTAVAI
ncbi:MAG TPA: M12 family metallo-peptidase [Pyrinomonadaceae bacterium]|nr:M12 family metallo-peptidase [Pyrinomonadaceae bacterium]